MPATKAIASLKLPNYASFKLSNYNSGRVDVQYFHDFATLTSAAGLNQSPAADVTATLGFPRFPFSAGASYDTSSGAFTKYNAGISVTSPDSRLQTTKLQLFCKSSNFKHPQQNRFGHLGY
ncbi:hypothetical protein MKW94_027348 [Papaver nudicaule]|uniref:Uncharacterized protein n=1 Tax=Papaver nudicaule TaxID=74823 RepID=A0AA41S3M1_PAPNU|nr:hypothetical protein [Papaver nudicaule]